MNEKLIGIEDLSKNFEILKIENNIAFLRLPYGRYTIKVHLPFEPNEKLASLFGHILGDGCIKSKEENAYYTNKSKELKNEFKQAIEELFGIVVKENFNEERQFYEVYPPKTIARFLVLCGFPKGQKVGQIITIPDWIKNGSNEIKIAFIRALYDDEGTVINIKSNFVVSFGMNKKKSLLKSHLLFMEEIQKIIFSLGVSPNKIFERKQPGDCIQLGFHIYRRYNLIKFSQIIGFTNTKKQEKLLTAINSYKTRGRYETKMLILEALKEKNDLKTKELCQIVNRDRDVVWRNVNRLVDEGTVKKILISKRGPIEKVTWTLNNSSKDI
jgi:intein/homing endonuclease